VAKKCSALDEFSLSKTDDGVSNEEKVISDNGSAKLTMFLMTLTLNLRNLRETLARRK
jgi:hypothetical protein